MAARNEENAYGKPKPPKKKPDTKKPSSKKPTGYDWGDGRKVHSIPLEQHQANRAGVKNYGLTPDTPLDAPLNAEQAYGMAQAAANRAYAPQLAANTQLQTNTPAWYQNYIDRTTKQQQAAQAYAAPMLAQAQAGVANAGQTTPGLDPSSPQYAVEQEAAKGRQSIAQLGYDTLAVVPAATDAYFGGQANTAARELPQVQAGLLSQYGQLASQREGAVTDEYGRIRTGEQNASLARQTLNLNTDKAAADVDLSRGVDPVTGKPLPAEAPKGYAPGGPGMNKYGYTADEWAGLSDAARNKARAGKPKDTTAADQKKQKDAEKKKAAIHKSTGAVKVDVGKVIAKWDSYRGQQTDDTSKQKDPKTGEYPARNLTPSDIKRILGEKHDPQLIHVALMVRAGKPLDQAAIDYLHEKDPNIRIPREWLKGKQKPKTIDRPAAQKAPKNAPDNYGQARPT